MIIENVDVLLGARLQAIYIYDNEAEGLIGFYRTKP